MLNFLKLTVTKPLHGVDAPMPSHEPHKLQLHQRLGGDWYHVATIATADSPQEAMDKRNTYLFWAHEAGCEITLPGAGMGTFSNPDKDVYAALRIEVG